MPRRTARVPAVMARRDGADSDVESEEGCDWLLGFVEPPRKRADLLRHRFPSKVGGRPAWLDPLHLPTPEQLTCRVSGKPLDFLLQVGSGTAAQGRRKPKRRPAALLLSTSAAALPGCEEEAQLSRRSAAHALCVSQPYPPRSKPAAAGVRPRRQ